jgi:UDP-N-acetylmuramate--alanine ligase
MIFIDDYAHHPTEIDSLLKSVKSLYPGKKITAVFQPHLFSRTRDFAEGFSKSLSMADKVILMNIYPARELPIPNVDAYMLLDKITTANKAVVSDAQLLEAIMEEPLEVLLTIGAGDIDRFVEPVQQLLKSKCHVE